MSKKKSQQVLDEILRKQAEKSLNRDDLPTESQNDELGIKRLEYELEIRNVELETQTKELANVEEELESAVRRYKSLYNDAPVGYFSLGRQGKILESNLACAALLRLPPSKLIGMNFKRFLANFEGPVFEEFLWKVFVSPGKKTCELFIPLDNDEGLKSFDSSNRNFLMFTRYVALLNAQTVEDGSSCRVVMVDISDGVQARERERLKLELGGICQSAKNAAELVHGLLMFFQRLTGCHALAIRLKQGEDYPCFETWGFPYDFENIDSSILSRGKDGEILRDVASAPLLKGIIGSVLRGEGQPSSPYFTNNGGFWTGNLSRMESNPLGERDLILDETYTRNKKGYGSFAALPLKSRDSIFGLLQLHDRRVGLFSAERVELLEYLLGYAGSALTDIRLSEDMKEIRGTTRRAKVDLDTMQYSSHVGTWVRDIQSNKLEWSDEMYCIFGMERIEGDSPKEDAIARMIHPDDLRILQASNNLNFAERKPIDYRIILPDGAIRHIQAEPGDLIHNDEGIPIYMTGAVQDITATRKAQIAERISNDRFIRVMEATNDGIWDYNLQTGEMYYSPSYWRMLDYDPASMTNSVQTWIDLVHPEDRTRALMINKDCIENRCNLFEFEFRMKNFNGGWSWILTRGKALERDTKGKALRIIGTHMDITQRKVMEDELRENKERFSSAFEYASIGMAMMSLDGGWLKVNQSVCDLIGYTAGELRSMTFQDITHPDDMETDLENMRSLLAGEILTFQMEKRYFKKSGQVVWAMLNVSLVRDDAGKPLYFITQILDVSERKRIEETLFFLASSSWMATGNNFFESEVSFIAQTLQIEYVFIAQLEEEGSSARTLAVFSDGKIVENFDYSLEDTPCMDVVTRDICFYPAMVCSLFPRDKMLQGLKAESYIGMPLRDSSGKAIGLLAAIGRHPMADQKLSENILKLAAIRASAELERNQIEEEKEALRKGLLQAEKIESIGRLAGGIAHDFNNLLGVIMGHTEIAISKIDPAQPVYRDLRDIQKAAGVSADLTRQLLAFARKQTVMPVVMNLNEAISSRLNMFRRVIREDIDLVFQPASGLWHVRIDPTQLDQILTNLLVNSRDAISGVGRVEIETTNTELDEAFCLHNPELSPGRYVVILVRDNGCGMDAETLPNIFEPFYTTKEQGKGTGLGLATVYGLIHQNNGHILVNSLIGEGTTFTIFLPRVEAELTRQEEKGEPKLPQGGHNLVVLLVEDEIALIDLAIDTLEELGYNVISSTKPLDAVILAQQHTGKIDLLITDVIMPGMNGQLLAERVREIKPEIKCLFMSGYSADIIADQGILPTGVNFIQKPFTLQDLANRVSEVLRLGEG